MLRKGLCTLADENCNDKARRRERRRKKVDAIVVGSPESWRGLVYGTL